MADNCAHSKRELTITLESASASPFAQYSRMLETATPSMRKSVSRSSRAERHFAFDTACQCIDEAVQSAGPDLHHGRYFQSDGYKVLREALPSDLADDAVSIAASGLSIESDNAEVGISELQLCDTASSDPQKTKSGLWKKIKMRLSTESLPKIRPPESPQKGQHRLAYSQDSALEAIKQQPGVQQEARDYSFVSINVEKALGILVAIAPGRGEVQHWVWLLRAFMNKCSIESVHYMLGYLAKVGKYMAPEEEWLRMLIMELTPVLNVMRQDDLPGGSQVLLRTVADRAMQIAEEAIVNFRSHRSSRLENAALLSAALELQILVTKCASGADGTDMGGVFEQLLTTAAHQRFRSLCFKSSAEAGVSSPTAGPAGSRDASTRRVASLAAVCDAAVQDIIDDEECYQLHFPPECQICLPSISCRTYCSLIGAELTSLLGESLNTNAPFFALFKAVHYLARISHHSWCSGNLGLLSSSASSAHQLFLPHIEAWMRGVRTKLLQWSLRLLKEEVWQHSASSMTGIVCSPSLVELFRALCSVAEDNSFVSAAHPAYASLMERTLSKVVLVHVSGMEKLCQGEMPSASGRRLGGQLRSLGSKMGQSPRGTPFQPSNTLCMLLSDMREIRSKQADLSNALRRSLPPDWWGQPADSNLKEKLKLGDRFKLCQVEIERRYAAVLHHTVKRMMESISWMIKQMLAEAPLEDSQASSAADPIVRLLIAITLRAQNCSKTRHDFIVKLQISSQKQIVDGHLAAVAPRLDVRVLRRVARELWNAIAGVLHDDLLNCQEGQDGTTPHSIDNMGPRIQHLDCILKGVSDHMSSHALSGLSQDDEPEKVMKLRKMLALFMREDEGKSIESI